MYKWTSEAVSAGHPDKVADQIADAILDAHLRDDPLSRCACEVTLTGKTAVISGEITSLAKPNIEEIVRKVICDIGFNHPDKGYDGNTIEVWNQIQSQSPEISKAVTKKDGEIGAGDQGIMFGYATDETVNFMPLAHELCFVALEALKNEKLVFLRPDAKSQVTLRFNNREVSAVDTLLISTQHDPGVSLNTLRETIIPIVTQLFESRGYGRLLVDTKWLINPAGEWTIGGPAADTGLSGRKIVVDNYGADCAVGGGSFSGKDPTKVDRSGAYMARYLAKNIVASHYAKRCRVQLAYAIGVTEPVSLFIQTFGSSDVFRFPDEYLTNYILNDYKSLLTPKGIIDRFGLQQPIFQQTASGGHFGREAFPWEKLDFVLWGS